MSSCGVRSPNEKASEIPRFTLYVKAAGDGGIQGTCPFSQKAFLVLILKVPKNQYTVSSINLQNKPAYFLALNPGQWKN